MPDPFVSTIADFASLPVAAAIFELDGTFVAINRASEALLGRPAADIVGRKAWEVAPGVEHDWPAMVAGARDGIYKNQITLATPNEPRQIVYINTLREYAGKHYVLSFAYELTTELSRELETELVQQAQEQLRKIR